MVKCSVKRIDQRESDIHLHGSQQVENILFVNTLIFLHFILSKQK